MDTNEPQLPWDELQHTEGDIPWPALRRFAEAVATDPTVTQELFDVYDQAYEIDPEQFCCADLYVPAIFALAAPKLDDERRRDIAACLLDRLAEAAEDMAELNEDALATAVGKLGPTVLPAILDAIPAQPDSSSAWYSLWNLTLLAAETEDPSLRGPVIQACVDLLERVDRNEIYVDDAHSAAWTLGFLKCTEYRDLLQRVCEKAKGSFLAGDYAEAVQLLDGELDYPRPPELWERSIEESLEYWCQVARNWVEKHDAEDEDDFDAVSERAGLLSTGFIGSAIAKALPTELQADAGFIADRLVYYSVGYLGIDPEEWDERALRKLLFDLLPRKVHGDEVLFAKIGPVTEAFLSWLGSEGLLADTDALAATVHGWSEEIVTAGMNPESWGFAKRLVIQAEQAGVDVTDSRAVEAYVAQQQEAFTAGRASTDVSEPAGYRPPVPIVEHSPKIGRNDPCPCGSGKKYKKCCGDPAARNTAGA
ncbi:MAG: SEC-C domain-containing protein [Sedimentisphaerales bacterium]|nr:SEC-C domain-containing protein [Sedimentisphaerales bacterium]